MHTQSANSSALASTTWEALGSSVVLRLTDAAALGPARAAIERELDAIDRACSRFRPDSELSLVNSSAGYPVRVSQLLMEALAVALRAAALTEGDVDPTLGHALELAGYDRDRLLLLPSRGEPGPRGSITVRALAGWRAVMLDRARATILVPRGIRLDLGATAKAWAADRAAASAAQTAGCGVLVSVGGDIATSGPAPAGGWRIRVTDDHRNDPSAPGQTVSILSGGLASSSTTVLRWSHDGHTMHHIIDPATQAPVETIWRTVNVAAACCTDANIATTAALVRSGAAAAWLEEIGLPARLLDRDGSVVTVGGWPSEPTADDASASCGTAPAR
jgi:thiamine biosynthesis lipoprotein ApbE